MSIFRNLSENSGLLGFWTLPIDRYSKEHYRIRCGNWICFRPQMRRWATFILLGPLESANLNHWTSYVLSSPVEQTAVGPRQHSRSWFWAPSGPMTVFLFCRDFYVFRNGASSSMRGGVWLLLVTPPLLRSDTAGSHSLTTTHSVRSKTVNV
jgi:hypothetical protein